VALADIGQPRHNRIRRRWLSPDAEISRLGQTHQSLDFSPQSRQDRKENAKGSLKIFSATLCDLRGFAVFLLGISRWPLVEGSAPG
jgi:hypothetical protein